MKERIIDPQFDPDREKKIFKMYVSIPEEEEERLTAKEKTQIGTLKALGFKDKRILRHYTSYAFMIGIIRSALGIGLGYYESWF